MDIKNHHECLCTTALFVKIKKKKNCGNMPASYFKGGSLPNLRPRWSHASGASGKVALAPVTSSCHHLNGCRLPLKASVNGNSLAKKLPKYPLTRYPVNLSMDM